MDSAKPKNYRPKDSSSNIKTFAIGVLIAVIFVAIFLGILNFFNIISLSSIYKPLSIFPHQKIITKKKTITQPNNNYSGKNIILNSGTIDLCKPFFNNPGESKCLTAVGRALTDTKGEVRNVAIGPLKIDPNIQKFLKEQIQQVWYIDIELATPLTTKKGKVINSVRIQIPVNGSKAIFRSSINQ